MCVREIREEVNTFSRLGFGSGEFGNSFSTGLIFSSVLLVGMLRGCTTVRVTLLENDGTSNDKVGHLHLFPAMGPDNLSPAPAVRSTGPRIKAPINELRGLILYTNPPNPRPQKKGKKEREKSNLTPAAPLLDSSRSSPPLSSSRSS